MPLYKIAYTQEMEMYVEGESRSEVLAEFDEAMEIEIETGDVLTVSDGRLLVQIRKELAEGK